MVSWVNVGKTNGIMAQYVSWKSLMVSWVNIVVKFPNGTKILLVISPERVFFSRNCAFSSHETN